MSFYSDRPAPLDYAPTRDVSIPKFFNQVYAWMFVGLAVTAVVGYFASQSNALLHLMSNQLVAVAALLGLFALAWGAQAAAMRISAGLGLVLFMAYAAAIGVLTCAIHRIYPAELLGGAFLVTAGVFGGVSIVGYVTKKDLSGIGGIAAMCVMGLFAASLLNIFIASSALMWIITYGIVLLFPILVAYKTQELKNIAYEYAGNDTMLGRAAVVGSIVLYISFINLFFAILRIMGSRK